MTRDWSMWQLERLAREYSDERDVLLRALAVAERERDEYREAFSTLDEDSAGTILHLTRERDKLRESHKRQVEWIQRLTRERDEALKSFAEEHEQMLTALDERDEARAEADKWDARCQVLVVEHAKHNETVAAELSALRAMRERLLDGDLADRESSAQAGRDETIAHEAIHAYRRTVLGEEV